MGIDNDVRAGADWTAAALTAAGYRADFSPSSLWEVERFLSTEAPDGRPRPRGLLGKDLDTRVAMVGGYVGAQPWPPEARSGSQGRRPPTRRRQWH
ncbi:hypothetical protein [Dactylosporangium sp. NPDC000521]|uniref:hypothetical protein n=1 Tax=Dactylosporangium sp. NPDC000521 TaxID=3363975 RepID=UPI0036B8081F